MPKPKKKVAYLISSFLPNMGGVEVGLHNIASRVEVHGWQPTIISAASHVKALRQKGWNLPYDIIALPPKMLTIMALWPWLGMRLMCLYLGALNKKHKFDFWHVTMGDPIGCSIVPFAKKGKNPIEYLIRCAGEDIQKQPDIGYGMRLDPKLDTLISSHLKNAQRLIAITDSVYDEYKTIGVRDDAIQRVPNGVTLGRFDLQIDRATIREKLGIKPDETLVLSVGRNHPKKNHKTLIDAGKHLIEKGNKNIKIMCVGGGCSDLQSYVDKHDITSQVILRDQIEGNKTANALELPSDQLIEIYKAADIFAFPSLMETFGIAIVEAMASGLPVIVGDSEGCRDIVERGKHGLMCNPNSAEDVAEKIKNLIDDPKLRENLIQKSRKRSRDFDWDEIVKRYVQIYQSAQA